MDKRTSLRRNDEKALQDAKRQSNLARAEVEASKRRVDAMEKELRERLQKERALRSKVGFGFRTRKTEGRSATESAQICVYRFRKNAMRCEAS